MSDSNITEIAPIMKSTVVLTLSPIIPARITPPKMSLDKSKA